MRNPLSRPAPRVVSSSMLKKRFPKLMTAVPDGDHLLQVWAIAIGVSEQGHDVFLTGCAMLGSFNEAQFFVPVPKDVFESWFPLAMLNAVPDDLKDFEALPPARSERVVLRTTVAAGRQAIDISANEGYEIVEQWTFGLRPTRRTRTYLHKALAVIPSELAGDFTETYQELVRRDFDDESPLRIAALCFAIASWLEGSVGE